MKNNMNILKIKSSMKASQNSFLSRSVFSLAMLSLLLLAGGCKKFLEKDPTFIVKENFYNNDKDVLAGLAGVYDILGREALFGDRMTLDLSISDEGYYNRSTYLNGVSIYVFDASNVDVTNAWRYLYEGIERANVFLSRIDDVQMDAAEKANVTGQVKFLRAYYYFILTSNWGSVPLKVGPTSSVNDVNIAGKPIAELYTFITSEMEAAEGMVKTSAAVGFGGKVTKSAVRGILAKVYLKMAGFPLNGGTPMYTQALKWAKTVIESGEHRLNPNYAQIFKNYAGDRYDIGESIWEAEFFGNRVGDFEGGRIGNNLGLQCNEDEPDGKGFAFGGLSTTKKLYDSYGVTDVRRDWNIAPYSYKYATVNGRNRVVDSTYFTSAQIYNRNAGKFRRAYEVVFPKNKSYTPENYPLLRYADVLLMAAEADTEVNGATAYGAGLLKQVRDRANATDVTASVTGDAEAMRTAVRKERFLELAFEGQRKWDLIRWGIFVSEMNQHGQEMTANAGGLNFGARAGTNVRSKNNLLPIPVIELSLNKLMVQNPGW